MSLLNESSLLQNFPWYPKPLKELTGNTASNVNDHPCLIWFTGTYAPTSPSTHKRVAVKLFSVLSVYFA